DQYIDQQRRPNKVRLTPPIAALHRTKSTWIGTVLVSKRRITFSLNFPNRLTFQKFLDFLILFNRMFLKTFAKSIISVVIEDVHFCYFQILEIFNIFIG